ncbi:hypothetical protein EJ110_NYTH25119 [Nymphaea thermarum]|nr:hypothetical protein EJ110_NYTH25119 [Nymphaea thermarum]
MASSFSSFPAPQWNAISALVSIKLNGDNYLHWKSQLESVMESQDLLEYVDGTNSVPSEIISTNGKTSSNPDVISKRSLDYLGKSIWLSVSTSSHASQKGTSLYKEGVYELHLVPFTTEEEDVDFIIVVVAIVVQVGSKDRDADNKFKIKVENSMHVLGFHPRWIELVMKCVSTVSYELMVNGCLGDRFTAYKGLRQGMLEQFDRLASMKVNKDKFVIFLEKTLDCRSKDLRNILQWPIGSLPTEYLGVPFFHGQLEAAEAGRASFRAGVLYKIRQSGSLGMAAAAVSGLDPWHGSPLIQRISGDRLGNIERELNISVQDKVRSGRGVMNEMVGASIDLSDILEYVPLSNEADQVVWEDNHQICLGVGDILNHSRGKLKKLMIMLFYIARRRAPSDMLYFEVAQVEIAGQLRVAGNSYFSDGTNGVAILLNSRGRVLVGELEVLEKMFMYHKEYEVDFRSFITSHLKERRLSDLHIHLLGRTEVMPACYPLDLQTGNFWDVPWTKRSSNGGWSIGLMCVDFDVNSLA